MLTFGTMSANKVSGGFRNVQRRSRDAGESYKTRKRVEKPKKQAPNREVGNLT